MPDFVIPDEAKQAQSIVEGVLGKSIVGIYLFGFAVAGGLKSDSDVDVLVAVSHPPTFQQRKALVAQLMGVSGVIGNSQAIRPLELTLVAVSDVVPWQFPPRTEFVYGEWLREQFEAGSIPEPACDPDLAIVLKKVRDNSLPLYGRSAAEVFDPVPMGDIQKAIHDSLPALLNDIEGDERNAILTLARMWLTAATGDIVSKDAATAWAQHQAPAEHAALLKYAREGYLGKVEDRWENHQKSMGALIAYMKENIDKSLEGQW